MVAPHEGLFKKTPFQWVLLLLLFFFPFLLFLSLDRFFHALKRGGWEGEGRRATFEKGVCGARESSRVMVRSGVLQHGHAPRCTVTRGGFCIRKNPFNSAN